MSEPEVGSLDWYDSIDPNAKPRPEPRYIDRPIATRFSVKVVGVSFVEGYPDNLTRLERALLRHAAHRADFDLEIDPLPAKLVREPDNPYDEWAIGVHVVEVGQIGHLPRAVAYRLARQLDAGEQWRAWVTAVLVHPDHPDRPGIDLRVEPA